MDDIVRDLARRADIAVEWTDAASQPQRVEIDALRQILMALDLGCATPAEARDSTNRLLARQPRMITATVGIAPRMPRELAGRAGEIMHEDGSTAPIQVTANADGAVLPAQHRIGYHRLRLADRELTVAVAPKRCVTVADLVAGRRPWGLAVQLYSLRREGDGGIGDSGALIELAEAAAARGADALALSPTHSLFPADPGRCGPYSPSSRLFLNPLLADPAAALGATRVRAARREDATGGEALIDWQRYGAAKYALLKRLFDDFRTRDLGERSMLAADFDGFLRDAGAALIDHARFEAGKTGDSPEFHQFLQWMAARAFATAQEATRAAGMAIGLIGDLAVGLDPAGSDVSARPHDFLQGLSVGAPPDLFNPRGQDWGLTTFSPTALLERGYEPFLATLRAALRHAGGVRIDHAMGLARLWLVPHGAPSGTGAYVGYPLDDLMRLIALESHRHHAIVIGEDLGTVPPEFRARCREAGIAGMDVLWFQRDGERFLAPSKWRAEAVAMTTTHDLPTVAGWWRGADLEVRGALGLADDDDIAARARDRGKLWRAFGAAGVATEPPPEPGETGPAVDAAIDFVGRATSTLAIVPLEDIAGLVEQPNLPGTIDEHPNWRRRLPEAPAKLLARPEAERRLRKLARPA